MHRKWPGGVTPHGPSSQNSAISDCSSVRRALSAPPRRRMVSNSSANLRAGRIVELGRPELGAARHRPGLDPPVTREQAAIKGRERRTRRRGVEGAGGAPSQRIRAPWVSAEVVVDLAGFRAVVGPQPQHLAAHRAAPFDAEGLGFAPGEAVQERHAFEQEGLLERLRRRGRESDAIGDFRVRAARTAPDSERFVVASGDAVGGEKPARHGQGIGICGARRRNSLVAHLLQDRIHPVKHGIPMLRTHDSACVRGPVPGGSDMGADTPRCRDGGYRRHGGRQKCSSGNTHDGSP